MSQTDCHPRSLHADPQRRPLPLEESLARSPGFALFLAGGLPVLGLVASLSAGLPPFAALMAACFLLASALVCRRAVAAFVGRTLRVLVAGRLVLIAVLASLLLFTDGGAWVALVGGALVWLLTDRLLGRRALRDLWALARRPR